ncbi:MAG: MAPEG family protein [Pseudomonadota bacterium]
MKQIIFSITLLILTFEFIFLSVNVIKKRVSRSVTEELKNQAIRAHGNFIEYTPFTLILLLILVLQNLPTIIFLILCILLILGRSIHAYGLLKLETQSPKKFWGRVLGMGLTFTTIILASLLIFMMSILLQ